MSGSSRLSGPSSIVADLVVALLVTVLAVPTGATPASAQTAGDDFLSGRIEIVPQDGTILTIGDRRYRGRVTVSGHDDGLAVVEQTDVDSYLEGIAEVPFGWPQAALEAQVVAARTYLAWTLSRGRSSNGRRYGYDICATTACQVYAGVGYVEGAQGDRWKRAVEATSDQILVFGGRPAQALYSSTTGGRTRNVEDVFPGASPTPYLVAVDSPGEDSPFVDWSIYLSHDQMDELVRAAELTDGPLLGVDSRQTGDGGGSWTVTFHSKTDRTVGTWELRTILNRAAVVLPDVLPAFRPDGRRYPQTILSPTFEIVEVPRWRTPPMGGPPQPSPDYRIVGHGWGHLVGMSQYGAEAMASSGSSASEILAHYYGGLTPQPAGSLLPATVRVGLQVASDQVQVTPDGPVTVIADGVVVADSVLGGWTFAGDGGKVRATPPVGLGLPPDLDRPVVVPAPGGPLLAVTTRTTAELRLVVRVGGTAVYDSGPEIHEAGVATWPWRDILRTVRPERPVVAVVTAVNPQGEDSVVLRVAPGLE